MSSFRHAHCEGGRVACVACVSRHVLSFAPPQPTRTPLDTLASPARCRCKFRSLLRARSGETWAMCLTSQSLLVSYKYSPEAVLPPDEVRRTLAIAYASEKRFKMGAMDDAGEALEAILTLHHTEQASACRESR